MQLKISQTKVYFIGKCVENKIGAKIPLSHLAVVFRNLIRMDGVYHGHFIYWFLFFSFFLTSEQKRFDEFQLFKIVRDLS